MTTCTTPPCYAFAPLARPLARAEGSAVPPATSQLPDWITYVAGVAAFLLTCAAGVFTWLWSERTKAHEKELQGKDAAAAQVAVAAAAELQKVRLEAEEKARVKADLAAAFGKVDEKLVGISEAIHEFREDFNGQIHGIKLSALAVEKRVAQLEQALDLVTAESASNHNKLNNLITGLRTAGIVVSLDPNSSTGLVAITPTKRS